jgi:hypothetical protein
MNLFNTATPLPSSQTGAALPGGTNSDKRIGYTRMHLDQ